MCVKKTAGTQHHTPFYFILPSSPTNATGQSNQCMGPIVKHLDLRICFSELHGIPFPFGKKQVVGNINSKLAAQNYLHKYIEIYPLHIHSLFLYTWSKKNTDISKIHFHQFSWHFCCNLLKKKWATGAFQVSVSANAKAGKKIQLLRRQRDFTITKLSDLWFCYPLVK